MWNRKSLVLILGLMSCAIVSGCNPLELFVRDPEVYVPADSVAELRGPAKLKVWAHDKDGKLIRGYVNAYDRWLVGPPAATLPKGKESAPATSAPSTMPEDDKQKMMAEIALGMVRD